MELFLIRHAAAEDASPEQPDADRALTRKGRKRFKAAVRGLRRLDVRFDVIRHSPLLRSVQTAELLAPLLDGQTVVDPRLAEAPSDGLLAGLSGARVALVGHQPWLGELCAWLTAGDKGHGEAIPIDKGGLAWLSGDPVPGQMHLLALFPLQPLRRMARK
ncbi:MAG: phosphohistidine phosphatase [Planctomycetota bacterium]|nr:MAG: phosphohistidine phosphatase [Planctomycetota bacterium]